MILTCPTCYSQFNVSLAVLGNQPRKVRCSACGDVWMEEEHIDKPVDNSVDKSSADADSFENIMAEQDGIKDDQEIPDVIKPDSGEYHTFKAGPTDKAKKTSYVIVAMLFVGVLASLLAWAPSMLEKYPASYALYRMFGYTLDLPLADKITFVHLDARDGEGTITVTADIVNLGDDPQKLKMMQIKLTDGADHIYASWYATPPKAILDGEETVSFKSEYHLEEDGHSSSSHAPAHDDHGGHDDKHDDGHHGNSHNDEHADENDDHSESHGHVNSDVKFVEVTFVMKPRLKISKTAEEDGEDTQALPEGGSDHQSDHGAH